VARLRRGEALYSLNHVIDLDWMKEAYRLTRKDGAPGIDGVTAATYEVNLEASLYGLLDRIKSGRCQAPPVRRAYIPKADGTERPLGIPTFEDKVAQRAIAMVLEAIYEQDFLPCSYGFRPGRSAHQALHTLRSAIWSQRLHWVLDVDIRKYFDSIPHSHLRTFLDKRVTDGVIRRMIDKWLKAGVIEDGLLHHTTAGSPQGGVISPCLSNIYLHYVLDEWFETEVRPRLKGRCILVRYADDLVMAFEHFTDAERVLTVLGKRLERYGLTLHPDKTRFVDFRARRPERTDHPGVGGTSFDFLGFTHVWGKSRNGKPMVRQVTAKSRYARALAAVTEWCRQNRHQPILEQHARLAAMMRGHFAYYGIAGNSRRLRWYARQVVRIWQKWLSRRGRHGYVLWSRITELLKRHPLPPPRIVRRYTIMSEALS
jgi:group II intron reverse transcriptase/maturase